MFFSFSWMNATEMAVLSGFWQRNDLGPLGLIWNMKDDPI